MPYYCTVPRCTSMAGKAKNVSFHQFPRDEELAKLWNRILKRGKPYTKYSKVCSLHFKPEDYTITSVGKNKGQWRTLRKDAIPSQNLPSESPAPYTRRSAGCWMPAQPSVVDPLVQQQMAQAIYMQTMLAMQAAGASESLTPSEQHLPPPKPTQPSPSSSSLSELDLLLRRDTDAPKEVTYKCQECTKCFKDPDVFLLHKRTHKNNTITTEKENYTTNIQREETLRANPILANLLKTRLEPDNLLTIENQIMTALTSNMEAYIRTLTSMLTSQGNTVNEDENKDESSDFDDENEDGNDLCKGEGIDANEANEIYGNDLCGDEGNDGNEANEVDGNDLCKGEGNDAANEVECEDADMCVDTSLHDTTLDEDGEQDETRSAAEAKTKEERLAVDERNTFTDENCANENDIRAETCNDQKYIVTDENHEHANDEILDNTTKSDECEDELHEDHNVNAKIKDSESDKMYEDKKDTHENHNNVEHKTQDTKAETFENKNTHVENYKHESIDKIEGNDNDAKKEELVYEDTKGKLGNPDCDSTVNTVALYC